MEQLDQKVYPQGTGIPNLSSTCVRRTPKKCIYLRSDGYYEVFIVKVAEEEYVFDKLYPKREVYPCSEDFGKTAWTTSSEKRAIKIFDRI